MIFTGQACKIRWISLRDQLRKTLKKKKSKRRQVANKQTKWKYEDCMSFIIPFFKERETHSLITSPESASEESNDKDISQQNNKTIDEDALNEDMKSEREITPKRNRIMRSPSQKTKSPKNMSAPYCSKAKKMRKPENASSVLRKYMLDKKNNESKATSYAHPIDTFFNGLAATVKTFSLQYQHMAKNQLFAIVSKLEWTQLQNREINNQIPATVNSSTSYFTSSSSSSSY